MQKQGKYKMNQNLNDKATLNFINIKVRHLILPILLLMGITLFIFQKGENFSKTGYIDIQLDSLFYLDELLSKMPNLQYNLTQFGDALISYSLFSIFILFAPKLWEVLLTSSITSLIVSALLKKIFAVPRPTAIFDKDSFTIIGKTLTGSTSLLSGHSITTSIIMSTFFCIYPSHLNNYAKTFMAIFFL